MAHFRAFLLFLTPAVVLASVFDAPELRVTPSPGQAMQVRLADGVRVIDSDVSPLAPTVALLVSNPGGIQEILLWKIGDSQAIHMSNVPAGLSGRALAWHPRGDGLFLSGSMGQQYAIFRIEQKGGDWVSRRIYSSRQEIRRLVPGPRPYVVRYDEARHVGIQAYRVFFGLRTADGSYSVRSVTEEGERDYQVVGRKENFTKFKDEAEDPSELVAPWALPVGFHPAGHLLLWEDGGHCFQAASYDRDHWKKSARLPGTVCGGTVSVTPNGVFGRSVISPGCLSSIGTPAS